MAREQLVPFVPDDGHPFGPKQAAHLLRRAGFGANPRDVAVAVEKGLEQTIDDLFADDVAQEQRLSDIFEAINGKLVNAGDPGVAQAWWAFRMLSTSTPLREKLTLFWHGHFATSVSKVGDTELMLQQIDTLRRLAWGNFRDLVLAVARDPAMLVWLDGESNSKEHPNENFARELMELFTCGIGHYSEQDVLEAARAFTGWQRNGAQFVFNADAHDGGIKTLFGRRGRFGGEDVVDFLLAKPATAEFIARKLLRFFAAPNPNPEVVAEAAALFDRTQLNVKLFLRELFQSQYFYSEECYRSRIASPLEFVLGVVRTLDIRQPASELVSQIAAMGQSLLTPPNVKGWDGEEKWINSTTLAARLSYARSVPELNSGDSRFNAHCPVASYFEPAESSPGVIVDTLARRLLNDELSDETRRELQTFLVQGDDGPQMEQFQNDEGFRDLKIRQLLGVMLSLPEYQAY
jgi:uncharacterized protein (DUF1800 family)